MSSKSPVRSCEDVDEVALSYAEIKALCAGNPLIKEKMDLDIEVARLRLLKADHQSQRYRLEAALIKTLPQNIEHTKNCISAYQRDIDLLKVNTSMAKDSFPPMEIFGTEYKDKEKAGNALLEICKSIKGSENHHIGTYKGFDTELAFDSPTKQVKLILKGSMSYTTDMGADVYGNITRINNTLADISTRLETSLARLDNLQNEVEQASLEVLKPFQFEEELKEKSARLDFLNVQFNLDDNPKEHVDTRDRLECEPDEEEELEM